MSYWKEALRSIVEVIIFLASRGLAFREHNQVLGSQDNEHYLGVLELLSKFDPFLADYLHNCANKGKRHAFYLSASTWNEFIESYIAIMGKNVPIERFLDFIPMEWHGAAYLSDIVVSFLKEKGIRLEDCRKQNVRQRTKHGRAVQWVASET
ncbi:hypothetical protein RI129_012054 [Pyrocoelia pectoralis]|uniref:Uncharacterized protein n=1 Tax=Pyrocoelia pectoralis TaxID=417401 RepID=A0AAN7ZE65_9COLE